MCIKLANKTFIVSRCTVNKTLKSGGGFVYLWCNSFASTYIYIYFVWLSPTSNVIIKTCSMYSHPSLFVGLYFAILQNRRVTPRMRLKQNFLNFPEQSGRFWSLKQVFKPYHMMFMELKEKKTQLPITVFLKPNEPLTSKTEPVVK